MTLINIKEHFGEVVSLCSLLSKAPLPLPEDILSRLTGILSSVDASEAYRDHFDAVQSLMSEHLTRWAGFPEMLGSYSRFPENAQVAWLQIQVNKLADFQSSCGIKVRPAIITPCHWGSNKDRATTGFDPNYDGPDPQNIFLNMDVSEIQSCPIEALGTVLHEQHHQFDNTLARETKFGRLHAGDPFFADGEYFMNQWAQLAFVRISPSYEMQLDERLAIAFGRSVRAALEHVRQTIATPITQSVAVQPA